MLICAGNTMINQFDPLFFCVIMNSLCFNFTLKMPNTTEL